MPILGDRIQSPGPRLPRELWSSLEGSQGKDVFHGSAMCSLLDGVRSILYDEKNRREEEGKLHPRCHKTSRTAKKPSEPPVVGSRVETNQEWSVPILYTHDSQSSPRRKH